MPISVQHEGYVPIFKTKVMYDFDWAREHLKTLKEGYAKAPNYEKLIKEIEDLIRAPYEDLNKLNVATLAWGIFHLFGEKTGDIKDYTLENANAVIEKQKKFRLKKIVRGSQTKAFKSFNTKTANEKIVAFCKELGLNEDYCGGTGVSAYLDHDLFDKNGIKVQVQDWKCNEYSQQYNKKHGFVPNLSIIDLLMNVKPKEAMEVIHG